MIRVRQSRRMFASFLVVVAIADGAMAQTSVDQTLIDESTGISVNQVKIPENTALILSAANRTLYLSYFDSAWAEIVVSPGATVLLPCRNGTVSIKFSNGISVRSSSLAAGTQYVLFFDDDRQQWNIDTLDSLLDRSSESK